MRLDQAMLARGLARSRSHAAQLIAQGAALVNGKPARKAAARIREQDTLSLLEGTDAHYVSRAALKLLHALEAFPEFPTAGLRFLDAGASTGGFTQVLLEAGAAGVVAADVGHDQLAPRIREDARVEPIDGLNLRYAQPGDIGALVDGVVGDLSFISLTLLVPALAALARPGANLMLMVKPQFEVGKRALPGSGVVTDPQARRRAVLDVIDAAQRCGLEVRGLEPSAVPGQDGNREYFLWLLNSDEAEMGAKARARDMVERVDFSR